MKCFKCGHETERLYGSNKLCFDCFWDNDTEITLEDIREHYQEVTDEML